MLFEPVTQYDLDEIRDLRPDDWPDIVPDFEFYLSSPYCHPVKTKLNDKIVGIGASIIFGNTGWIAHIIVDKNYRNKGIGSQIVNCLLEVFKKKSVLSCSLIATDLGKPVYMKAGFRTVAEYSFLRKEKPWKNRSISDCVIPFKEEYRSQIYDMDKKISGESRENLLANFLPSSMIYKENNEIAGYYIPDLKEGLIFADTINAGIELMKLKYSKIDKAVLPSDNKAGINFLLQNGFLKLDRVGTRMVLGKDVDWKPDKIFSRIGGNLG
ncbi:MAG TPA: GNAT family N-acetyltransferase [Bacteroidales bacterium]